MPIVHIHVLEGRSSEQKRQIIREITEATARSADVPADRVRVLIHEIPNDSWGTGGITKKDSQSNSM